MESKRIKEYQSLFGGLTGEKEKQPSRGENHMALGLQEFLFYILLRAEQMKKHFAFMRFSTQ